MSQKKIVLVGGGSGGHFYPLIAIGEALKDIDPTLHLYYLGPSKYSKDALDSVGVRFTYIPAGKRRRYFSPLNVLDFFKNIFGIFFALVHLYRIYPDVVMSKGGYTSVPVTIAAFLLRIPIVAHESDSKIGGANKLALRFSREFIVAFDEAYEAATQKHQYVHKFGIPVRKAMFLQPNQETVKELGVHPDLPLILVLGGSQGAERLNRFVIDALNELLPQYSIVHQTGEEHLKSVEAIVNNLIVDDGLRARYHPVAYLKAKTLNTAYHISQLVISRAGSTTIYEIALHHKPSIIVPIPESISHDQRSNAYAYAGSGASTVIEEENMSDDLLRAEIDRIIEEQGLYESMQVAAKGFALPDAASQTAGLIHAIAGEHDR